MQSILDQVKSDSGFSLMELIIIIVMISILSLIALPNISRWLPYYRLKSAARDVQSNMQKARMMTIKNSNPVEVRFDRTKSPGFYYFDTVDDDAYTTGELRIDLSSYGSGVDFGVGNASSDWNSNAITQIDQIEFRRQGVVKSSGTVYLDNRNSDICYAITILITGTPVIRKYNGSNYWIE